MDGLRIFWTIAFVCFQVILSHYVSSTQTVTAVCVSKRRGGFGRSAELNLVVVDRTFWEVILWLCVRAECEELQG